MDLHDRDVSKQSLAEVIDAGFTMLELLLVMVVLGVLAATVMLGLGGMSANAAQASCTSDAKNVEVAVQTFHVNRSNTAATNEYPTSPAQLTDPASDNYGGPYLHSWPSSSDYTITLDAANPGKVYVNGQIYDGSTNPCSTIS
jgi:prepilin-type N-terminal cleavage/methylation domain-containing protein